MADALTLDQIIASGKIPGFGKGGQPPPADTANILGLLGKLRSPTTQPPPREGLNGVPTGMVTAFQTALKGNNPIQPAASQNPYGGFVQGGWGLPHDRLMRSTPQDGLLLAGTGPGTVQNPANNPYPALPVDNSPIRPVNTNPVIGGGPQPSAPYQPPVQQQPVAQPPVQQQPVAQIPVTQPPVQQQPAAQQPKPVTEIDPGTGTGALHNIAPNGALATGRLNLAERFGPLRSATPMPGEGFLQFAQRIGFPVGEYGAAANYAMGSTPGGSENWLKVLQSFYGS